MNQLGIRGTIGVQFGNDREPFGNPWDLSGEAFSGKTFPGVWQASMSEIRGSFPGTNRHRKSINFKSVSQPIDFIETNL